MDKQYAEWLKAQINNCQCAYTLGTVMIPHVEVLIDIYRREANNVENSPAVRHYLASAQAEFELIIRSH